MGFRKKLGTSGVLLLSSLTVTGLFVLRRRGGDPAFRCPGYPVVPATHSARNIGTNTFREVLIEFKN